MKLLSVAGILSGALITALGLSDVAHAGPVDIQLNVGTQPVYAAPGYPPAILSSPPLMVWLSNLGVYAAYGASQPIFYQGSNYYYYYGNRWWAGPGYRGPWRPIAAPPPALRRWNHRDWPNVQRNAGRYARDPHWRHFRPAERPHPQPYPQRPSPQVQRPQPPHYGSVGRPDNPGRPSEYGRPGPQGPGHDQNHGKPDRWQNNRDQGPQGPGRDNH
ncbi:MAG: hypothetical protein WCY67_06470 [Acidithiobacillus sp.]